MLNLFRILISVGAFWLALCSTTYAQDSTEAETPLACGGRTITIASMQWPSAAILAEIHQRIISTQLGCEAQIVPGDLSASLSSMATTGQPAIAPEMWISRVATIWNSMSETQQVRALSSSFTAESLEGWFVPDYLAQLYPDIQTLDGLKAAVFDQVAQGEKMRFVSCPADWACALINRNMLKAAGLTDLVELAEPANRFEMDTLIAQAVSGASPILFYYWQPNAILAQFNMVEIDLGSYEDEAFKCLALNFCEEAQMSDFTAEAGSIVVSDWLFDAAPAVTNYLVRANMPLDSFNELLSWQAANLATPEQVADYFIQSRPEIWSTWLN